MGRLRLWPIVRKLSGKAGSFATYVERFPVKQVLLTTYFRYRRFTGRSKYWPNRGQFFLADRFWTAQSIAWRKKWSDAVKKHGLTGYSLWMKEALYHLVRQVNAPEDPSSSGGYADPPLNPGERLEPCPPKAPPHPPEPPGPVPEPPPEDPTLPCWICEALDEETPWMYRLRLEYEAWPSPECDPCAWYVWQRQEPPSPCIWWEWQWNIDYEGVTEVTYYHEYDVGDWGWSGIGVYNSYWGHLVCEWERRWYVAEMGPVCSYIGDEFELVFEAPGARCGAASVTNWWVWSDPTRPIYIPPEERPEPPPPPEPPPYGECDICWANDEPTPWRYQGRFHFLLPGYPCPLEWEFDLPQERRNPCGWSEEWYHSGLDGWLKLLYHHEYWIAGQVRSELWFYHSDWRCVLASWAHYSSIEDHYRCLWLGELELEFCMGGGDCGEAWITGYSFQGE